MVDTIRIDQMEDTAVLTLDNAATLNGIDRSNLDHFPKLVESLAQDERITYLVVRGANNTFCGGGSIGFLKELLELSEADRVEVFKAGQCWIDTLRRIPLLTVAAVDGLATGAGFDLMLGCDGILLAPGARLNFWFGKLGGLPDLGGLVLLAERVGPVRALEIYASSKSMGAQDAAHVGIGEVVPVLPESPQAWSRWLRRNRPIERTAWSTAKRLCLASSALASHQLIVAEEQARLFSSPHFRDRLDRVFSLQSVLHGEIATA